MIRTALFYKDHPIFGLDIGYNSLKVMQIQAAGKSNQVIGYGIANFKRGAIKDGEIIDPEAIAKSAYELLEKNLIGDITTRRVVMAIPAGRTFNRAMQMPKLKKSDIAEAVRLEAEQYIPMPINELYVDYNLIRETETELELLVVAVPRKIVDSYLALTQILGLEVVAVETTIAAATRVLGRSERHNIPTILIDFGTRSTDITVYDKTVVVTGTVPSGGDTFTEQISEKLKVSTEEAHIIKAKYGLTLSKKQKEITAALDPVLEQLLKEIRRIIRYYEERYGEKVKIGQIVTMGGGANMPGLSEYMIDRLRLPVRMCEPWSHLNFARLQPPNTQDRSLYVTVTGLSLMSPKEIFS